MPQAQAGHVGVVNELSGETDLGKLPKLNFNLLSNLPIDLAIGLAVNSINRIDFCPRKDLMVGTNPLSFRRLNGLG
jgi:hypothetical protein